MVHVGVQVLSSLAGDILTSSSSSSDAWRLKVRRFRDREMSPWASACEEKSFVDSLGCSFLLCEDCWRNRNLINDKCNWFMSDASVLQSCSRDRLFGDFVSYSLISETLPALNKVVHSALLRLHFQQPGREWIKLSLLREQLSFFCLSVANECAASMSLVALFERAVSIVAGWEGKITVTDWRQGEAERRPGRWGITSHCTEKQERKVPLLEVSCDCSLLQQSSLPPEPLCQGPADLKCWEMTKSGCFCTCMLGCFPPCASFMFCTCYYLSFLFVIFKYSC